MEPAPRGQKGFSRLQRIGIVGGLVVVLGYALFTYTGLGGTLLNVPLRVQTGPENGLVGYWSFDSVYAASSSGEVIDDSGQGNHGNIMNNASTSDTLIDATSGATDTWHLNASPQTVFVSESKGYTFYVDGPSICVMASTTDGGATWSSTSTVDSVNTADCIGISVWYDGWTPGLTPTSSTSTKIHIATIDTGADDIYYTTLDTESEALSSTQLTMTQGATFNTAANYVSITRAADSRLYVTAHDTTDSFMLTCSANCHTTANWTEIAATTNTLADDTPLLIALPATTTVMKILMDMSAEDYLANIYNPTTNTWRATTTIDANAPDNTTYDAQFGATVDDINNKVYFVYAADVNDYTTQDHDVRAASYDPVAQAWTNKTDVITNSSGGITDAKVAYDENSNTVFAIYTLRSTIGTAASARTYFKYSTDGMTTWSPQMGPIDVGASDWYGGADSNILGDRLFNARHSASGEGGTDDRWGNTVSKNVGVYAFTEGRVGQGYQFDGVDDYVEIADSDSFSPTGNGFSVSTWVNLDTITPPDGSSQEPVSKGSSSNFEWALRAEANGTAAFILFQSDGSNHCIAAAASTILETRTWYHLTGVWTGSDCEMYINGVRLDFNNTPTGSLSNGTAPVRIGMRASNNRQTKGRIDEVRVYDRPLSADEVDQIYKIGATTKVNTTITTKPALENGLVGHWTMDGRDVSLTSAQVTAEVRDRSGNANHGDWQNHASTTVVGRIGQGLLFDGSDDVVGLSVSSALDLDANYTLAMWINPAHISGGASKATILKRGTSNNLDPGSQYQIRIDQSSPSDNFLEFVTSDGATAQRDIFDIVPTNTWSFIICTHDGTTKTCYMNMQVSGTPATDTVGNFTGTENSQTIGCTNESCAGGQFAGGVDDVRIYNRVLSFEEMTDLYQLGATSKINTTVNTQPVLESSLLGHFTFDGVDANLLNLTNEIRSRGSGGLSGNWENHASTTEPGRIGQGIRFDGINDKISLGASTDFFRNADASSIVAWVKPDAGTEGPFFSTSISGGANARFNCNVDEPANAITVTARAPDSGGGVSANDPTPIHPGEWIHVACVVDVANDTINTYKNGVLVESNAVSFTNTATDNTSPSTVNIGLSANELNTFAGVLDDFRMYSRALSAAEVMMLYQLGN